MEKKRIRRQVADRTRASIIKSARQLFAARGFSGTSTKAIASAANVNETLIFHHFGSKADLWKRVKDDLINDMPIEPLNPEPASLQLFLQDVITQRLSAYEARPDLIRLLQWQRLESDQNKLSATHILTPQNWLTPMVHLQRTGKIATHLSLEIIMIWLQVSINAVLFDNIAYLQHAESRHAYLKTLLAGFEKALTTSQG